MNLEQLRAEMSIQDACDNASPEETIEICRAAINEAERIMAIAEKEIEDRGDSDDETDND